MSMQMLTDERTQGKFDVFNLNSQGSDLEGTISTAMTDSDKGLAYRYAILRGNPFVILGADYHALNDGGQLDLYDAATGQGTLTQGWLKDRARFLAAQSSRNGGTNDAARRERDVVFVDLPSNEEINTRVPGIDTARYVIFGGEENNQGASTLKGGDFEDHLYGEGGADTLQGGSGSDHLEGGQGHDTYVLSSQDSGVDTIVDVDGDGHLEVDGSAISGVYKR
ncbi:hypothetical protein CK626_13970, partial [Vandammella animalimorsus]